MKITYMLAPVILAGVLAAPRPFLLAATQQGTAAATSAAPIAVPVRDWTTEQAVTSSVREAWTLGGKTGSSLFYVGRTFRSSLPAMR